MTVESGSGAARLREFHDLPRRSLASGPKHLQRYLDAFSYRFDRRWREDELFGFVLRRVAGGQPLAYRQLVAEGTA